MPDLFNDNTITNQAKQADAKTKITPKSPSSIPEPKGFTQKCAAVLAATKDNVVAYYRSNEQAIEKEMKVRVPLYSKIIAMSYAVLALPRTAVQNLVGGGIKGMAVMFIMDTFVFPCYTLFVKIFDVRTYQALWKTIIGLVCECIPTAFKTIFFGFFDAICDVFDIIKGAIGLGKKAEDMVSRQMLTEAQHQSFLRRIVDKVKQATSALVSKIGSTMMYVLKKGYSLFEYTFLKFFNPIIQCIQKNNHLAAIGVSGLTGANAMARTSATAFTYIGTTFGINMAAGTPAFAAVTFISGWWVMFGVIAGVFTLVGYLAMAGQLIEMAELVRDVMDFK